MRFGSDFTSRTHIYHASRSERAIYGWEDVCWLGKCKTLLSPSPLPSYNDDNTLRHNSLSHTGFFSLWYKTCETPLPLE